MSRIKVTQYEEAGGALKEAYDDIIRKRGKLSEVLKIQSLHPASVNSHVALYMDVMFQKTALSRAEKEMIAVVVSAANGCRYCLTHHGAALKAYWKADERVEALKKDYRNAELAPREEALCRFAIDLTLSPGSHQQTDKTVGLRSLGFTDEAILDVSLITSYFNFVNRMVLGLGVQLEEEKGEGYTY